MTVEIPQPADGYTFIYGLIDPRTNEVRYVGKSKSFGYYATKEEAYEAYLKGTAQS